MNEACTPAILGGGAFGVSLASVIAQNGHRVNLWARNDDVCRHINTYHHHPSKLTNIILPHAVFATSDVQRVLKESTLVVIALPMHALASVLSKVKSYIRNDALVVCTTKGIDEDSLALPCHLIEANLSENLSLRACYVSGPSFAIEVALGLPTALVVAGRDGESTKLCQKQLSGKKLRLYRSSDVVGVCVAGALKNVIAIAAGVCAGLNLGKNAQASLITRGLFEVTRLARAMGGRAKTLSGLSGVGDFILSCTDGMSRNYRLGLLLAQGLSLKDALLAIQGVAEGANTAKAIPRLTKLYSIEMPIAEMVYKVLYQGLLPQQALELLLSRTPEREDS